MRRLIASGVAATAALIGLALPADAAVPTCTIDAKCDHVTLTLADYPATSNAKLWAKSRRGNYGNPRVGTVDANGGAVLTYLMPPATSYYTDNIYRAEVYQPGKPVVILAGTFTRC